MIVISDEMIKAANAEVTENNPFERSDFDAHLFGALNGISPEAKRELASQLLRSASEDEGCGE
jgi:hypothetical protein